MATTEFQRASFPVHFLGLLCVVLVLTWVIYFRNGLNLFSDDANKIFNAHPVIQISGFIFIFGEATLVYKTLDVPHKTKKLVHMVMQGIAFLFGLLGVWAAYKFHKVNGVDNFYSLHSWLGILTLGLFFIQFLGGFISFWLQSVGPSTRAILLPWHVTGGLVIYFLAVVTATTGYLEKMTFLNINVGIGHYAAETIFVNITGMIFVIYAIFNILAAVMPSSKEEDGYQQIG